MTYKEITLPFSDQSHIVVLGAGVTAQSYLRWVQNKSFKSLTIIDENPEKAAKSCAWFAQNMHTAQKKFQVKSALTDAPCCPQTILLLSPGWYIEKDPLLSYIKNLQALGGKSFTDFDLFVIELEQKKCVPHVIGITGTNGKTTTTDLMAHIFRSAGLTPKVGGNIGTPILSLLKEPVTDEDLFLFELSSFQLMQLNKPQLTQGVFLNISPDHLNYHADYKEYFLSKLRIISADQIYIPSSFLNEALPAPVAWPRRTQSIGYHPTADLFIHQNKSHVTYTKNSHDIHLPIAHLQQIKHIENGAFAAAVTLDAGLAPKDVEKGLKSYKGLPHRQQVVCTKQHVTFVNDSKATNVHAALQALDHFDNIQWLVGGIFKEASLSIPAHLHKKIREVFCYGQDGAQIQRLLNKTAPEIKTTIFKSLEDSFAHALFLLQKTEHASTILLSPMCASFDAFRNFEERGDFFTKLSIQARVS